MLVDAKPTLFGVGALIVYGDEFAVVCETMTNPRTAKVAGQETFPMETVESSDTGDFMTIGRACSEEVKVPMEQIKPIRQLNSIRLRPDVEVRNYLVELLSKDGVESGTFTHEVSSVRWIPLREAIDAKRTLRFRPGVTKTIEDLLDMRRDPEAYTIRKHGYHDLEDKIPPYVFKMVLEGGLSGKEAVFRWNALQRRQLGHLFLVR